GEEQDLMVGNSLVNMYAKCRSLADAIAIFDRMKNRSVFSWTIMVTAFAQNGQLQRAIQCYRQMCCDGVDPNAVTFVALLAACSSGGELAAGRKIAARVEASGLDSDLIVGSAIVNFYGKCGRLDEAREAFDRMPAKNNNVDVVSWTNMIAAYVQHGQSSSALLLAKKMDLEGVKPDEIAMSTILGACTAHQATSLGRELHRRARELGYASNTIVGNALVFMYGSWGRVDDAARVFQELKNANSPDSNTFTAMIAGYARQGRTLQALSLYNEMNLHGVEPRDATFTSIFQACSHAGFLAK
ncbi:hypothetical protein SELMODRAFT_11063, partial [Selaginella moellendorffii]